MKKIVLSVLVVGALMATSCKKAKEAKDAVKDGVEKTVEKTGEAVSTVKEGVEATGEAVKEAVSSNVSSLGIEIPKFDDPKVGEYVKKYADYAVEYVAGNVQKNPELAKKGIELAEKGKEVLAKISPADAEKFGKVMNAIQSKMAPAQK